MNPGKTLMLIGHKAETVRKAKALGLDVIFLQHKSQLEPEQSALADMTFVVDYRNWSDVRPIVEMAHQTWGIAAALSLTEPGLDTAARINDLLGLGGTGYQISRRLRDKWQMRCHLAASGADSIAFRLVSDRESLSAFGDAHGYPFITKPTDMTAGWGVLRVASPAQVPRIWDEIQRLRREGVTYGTTLFTIQDFLMEEYVSGPEYSVEGFSFGGRHTVIAVTEKLVDPERFAELGHTLPARIDQDLERAIVGAVRRFLDAIGLDDGPSHTEVRVGARGPVVIESHNRVGGDHIGDLLRAAYGIDLVEYTLGWPFRIVAELPDRPRALAGACIRFLYGSSGRVVELGGLDEVRVRPEVLAAELSVEVGDVLRPLHNNWDRHGLVAVCHRDSHAAARLCDELIRSLRIETAAETTPPRELAAPGCEGDDDTART